MTFQADVLARSEELPVVVDLWAPWCGPCRTLGPIIEHVVDAAEGKVELVKVNVDENPQISQAFQVQSIPAVYAIHKGKIVDSFIGALPERAVQEWVDKLVPQPSEADNLAVAGANARDASLLRQALDLQPDHPLAVSALAEILVEEGAIDEALALLARIPESPETRRHAARARLIASHDGEVPDTTSDDLEQRFAALLPRVKDDEKARQEYVDLLEAMDPDDPRRAALRRSLSSQLF